MKITHAHVASLVFERALMIEKRKLRTIINAIGPRIGADVYDEFDDEDDPVPRRERESTVVDGIAVIEVYGSLVKRTRGLEAMSGLRSYEDLEYEMLEAATNPSVSGILLDIDSGGGEAGGAFDVSDLIYRLRADTPIYGIANENALSAAYAIASAAERLYVTKTGLVGSVGVIAVHCDQSGFDSKVGVKYTPITYGERKNDFSPHEALTDEAAKILQAEVDRLGDMFVETVARNRRINSDSVRGTEAGIIGPEQALSVGFADEIGTKSDALAGLNSRISKGRRKPLYGRTQRAAAEVEPTTTLQVSKEYTGAVIEGAVLSQQVSIAPASAEAQSHEQEDTSVSSVPNPTADVQSNPPTENPTVPVTQGQAQAAETMTAAEISDLTDLCMIAGKPALLADFIRRRVSFAAAKNELITNRASASGDEIQSVVMPHVGTQAGGGNPRSVIDACKRRAEAMQARG